jgi:hypothetical protein
MAALASTPQLALRRAHPVAVMYRNLSEAGIAAWNGAAEFSPLTRSLPEEVHLFSLGRRAFQKYGVHVPDYPASSPQKKQGALRLQNLEQQAPGSGNLEVDVSTLFTPVVKLGRPLASQLEERTLSLARRPDEVHRRAWHGVGAAGSMLTPPTWRGSVSNSSTVSLAPSDIRSFVFPLD